MPKYLRGLTRGNDYQQGLRLKAHMAKTAVPEVKPKDWDFLYKRVQRRYSGINCAFFIKGDTKKSSQMFCFLRLKV